MRIWYVVLIGLFVVGACAKMKEGGGATSELTDVAVADENGAYKLAEGGAAAAQPAAAPEHAKELIKTGYYRFQVEDVQQATNRVRATVIRMGAQITDQNLVTSGREVSNSLKIRVPAQAFEAMMDSLGRGALATDYRRVTTEDVTEQFVDIEIRLRMKKEVRDRYIEILRGKAKTVEDVLKAEEQIRILQEEIEAQEGRLRYLRSQVSMSTINLEIYQRVAMNPAPDEFEESFLSRIQSGLINGWDLVKGTLVFLVNIWPFVLLAAIGIWRWKWIRVRAGGKKPGQ